jgi:hypothetical protein
LLIGAALFILIVGAFVMIMPESLPPEIPLPDFLNTSTPSNTPLPTTTVEPTVTTVLPTSTQPPTFAPPTAGFTPTLTFTSTLSPGQLQQQSGGLVISGPVAPEVQIRLFDVSLQFIANTFPDAKRIGESINGKGYGSPTLICGPLSIAILRNAGLIPASTVPYDFWLLNPDDAAARLKLKEVFPPNKYTHTRLRMRIDQIDWRSQPLQPGDFLYIYAGTGGNFEHMLVVNRVDNFGRAYSVTNVNSSNGFVIQEVLLYDPSQPNTGMFYQWTDKQWAMLGSTGFGGIELWRLIPIEPTLTP